MNFDVWVFDAGDESGDAGFDSPPPPPDGPVCEDCGGEVTTYAESVLLVLEDARILLKAWLDAMVDEDGRVDEKLAARHAHYRIVEQLDCLRSLIGA